ncbi:hypothetical protein D3C75_821560 [compost metagenome]
MKIPDHQPFFLVQLHAAGRLIIIESLLDPLQHFHLNGHLLLAALQVLAGALQTLLHGLHICQDQLQVDGFDIAKRVHLAGHVGDVLILEAAHHVDNGIHLADMGQELVAQTLALTCAFYKTGNIDKFKSGRHDPVGIHNLRQLLETLVRHFHYAHIGINGTERVIGGFRPGLGNCIEQRRFAHIGQPDNTCF